MKIQMLQQEEKGKEAKEQLANAKEKDALTITVDA